MTMDGITSGGQSFMEAIETMVRKVERLERITKLFAAPILPYANLLKREAFHAYLEARCSPEWNDEAKPWQKESYAGEFAHKKTCTRIKIPDQWSATGDEPTLIDLLITIASFEGRMPARVLADIQPDAFPSAIDALASATQEFPE